MVILYFSSWGKISPGHEKNKFSNDDYSFWYPNCGAMEIA